MVVGMNDCPTVGVDGFLVRNAEEIDIGAVDEVALSVGASDPHGCRRAVGDPAEPHLAFAQRLLHAFALVDILYQRVIAGYLSRLVHVRNIIDMDMAPAAALMGNGPFRAEPFAGEHEISVALDGVLTFLAHPLPEILAGGFSGPP